MPAELEFYILRGSEKILIGGEALQDGSMKILGAGLRRRGDAKDLIPHTYTVYVNDGTVEVRRGIPSFDGRTEISLRRLLPGQSCSLEVLISEGIPPNIIKITNTT